MTRERWTILGLLGLTCFAFLTKSPDLTAFRRATERAERFERVAKGAARESAKANALADSLRLELATRDSLLDAQRAAYRVRNQVGKNAERTAAANVVTAGATLDATLDSVRVILPVLGDSARSQLATERWARDAYATAIAFQRDEALHLLSAVDSTLALTNRALAAEREAKEATLRLAESWRVTFEAERAAKEEAERRSCGKKCQVGKVVVGVAVGVGLKTLADLLTP